MNSYLKKEKSIFIKLLIIVLMGNICLNSCSDIENKKYLKEKISLMYNENPYEPMKKMKDALSDETSTVDFLLESSNTKKNYDELLSLFNMECEKIVNSDTILKKYFNTICLNISPNEKITIEMLNFYSMPVRDRLEKELGVKLYLK